MTAQVEFIYPAPETIIEPAFTSPYHLVAVSKQGEWEQQMRFVLVAGSGDIAETIHFIP